jgi:hypothetical protein
MSLAGEKIAETGKNIFLINDAPEILFLYCRDVEQFPNLDH